MNNFPNYGFQGGAAPSGPAPMDPMAQYGQAAPGAQPGAYPGAGYDYYGQQAGPGAAQAPYDPSAYPGYGYGYGYPPQQAGGYGGYGAPGYGPDMGMGYGGPSVPKAAPPPPPADFPGPFQLFVGDLSREVTESILHATFAQHGVQPKSAKIMTDSATGRSKGFGFVIYETRAEAERALNDMQQALVGSRRIRLAWGTHHKWASPGQAPGPAPLPPAGPYGPGGYGPQAYGPQPGYPAPGPAPGPGYGAGYGAAPMVGPQPNGAAPQPGAAGYSAAAPGPRRF